MKNQIQNQTKAPAFDDIVFEVRNKEYGAYVLRRTYNRNVAVSLFFAVVLMFLTVLIPYLNARAADRTSVKERKVENIVLANLDKPAEQLAPPPSTPPPPETAEQQAKYVPPVVVDSVKPGDEMQLITADEAEQIVQNTEVIDAPVEIREEVAEVEEEIEPFIVVEEMPSFPGGDAALLAHIGKNLIYPTIAQENNIQGVVIVRFCVMANGGIDKVGILKSVDPELDKEAMRVVNTLPAFIPGKQGGKPVPVWFRVPIRFRLQMN